MPSGTNKNGIKLPELLAPCGSPESLEAAVLGGADAVYLGGSAFNARMNARNFDDASLREAVERCHRSGVRVYVALNAFIYDRELDDALRYAAFAYEAGADALIVADLGLASLVRRYIPSFPLHASTQASGHSAAAAAAFARLGFTRMVCAREMPADDICALVRSSPIEIEMFVHGALCVSHSGQCLLSYVMGGRSGNRGECAQPCRQNYNKGYPLSLRDNCLAAHIPEIIKTGVASLKIEGRMKPPGYVYEVTSVYRRLLDENRKANSDEISRLAAVFSRSGFTDGYYTGKIGTSMLGVRTGRDKAATVKQQTKFRRIPRNLEIITAERSAVTLPAKIDLIKRQPAGRHINTARFMTPEQTAGGDFFDIVYLPLECYQKTADNVTGVVLPAVIYDPDTGRVEEMLKKAYRAGARYALAGNAGHIEIAARNGFTVRGDFRLNIFNSYAAAAYSRLDGAVLSPELTLPQMRDIGGIKKGAVVYGRLPLMLLEKPVGAAALRDRTGACFPVIKTGGRDILLNSVPLYMADKTGALDRAGIEERHFIFTVETRREAEAVVEAYKNGTPPAMNIRRIKT